MRKTDREKATVEAMIAIYCRHHHNPPEDNLCDSCRELLQYASARLDRCPHGNRKPSCRRCNIHCYSPARRKEIAAVMRFSGPRIFFVRPIGALRHMLGI